MSAAVLPCPCCGSAASDTGKTTYSSPTASGATWDDGEPVVVAYFVNCMSCGLSNKGIAGGYRTKEQAVAAWNKRAGDADMLAALKYAEEMTCVNTGSIPRNLGCGVCRVCKMKDAASAAIAKAEGRP